MRCSNCDYPLWNLTARNCPECGTAFRPSDLDFVINSVRFCCPHCDQAYYGTGARGHLYPLEFDCIKCRRRIAMDEMVLRPAEGVTERDTRLESMPWLEARTAGARFKAWFSMIGVAMISPHRMMGAVPQDTSVVHAWVYAMLTWLVFMAGGFGVPFVGLGIILLVGGDPAGMELMATGAGMTLGGTVFMGVFMVFWGPFAHGILLVSGGCSRPLGRTYETLCYSTGANAISAVPCFGPCSFVGGIWWIISATFMLMGGQQVSGVRAATAAITFPVIIALSGVVAYGGFTFWALQKATTAMAPMAAQGEIAPVTKAILDHAANADGAGPDHAVLLVADGSLSAMQMIMNDSETFESDVPVGASTLDELQRLGHNRVMKIVDDVAAGMPENVVAHRLGDFVFTYHGADLNDPDIGGLWVVVMTPDPEVQGNDGPMTIGVGFADGTAIGFPVGDLPTKLNQQNGLRAELDLPPLPNPTTVTHAEPAVSQ